MNPTVGQIVVVNISEESSSIYFGMVMIISLILPAFSSLRPHCSFVIPFLTNIRYLYILHSFSSLFVTHGVLGKCFHLLLK